MVRRVKAYLKNMKVITDEEKLLAMSMECEPPSGGIQIAQPSVGNDNLWPHSYFASKKVHDAKTNLKFFDIVQQQYQFLTNSKAWYLFILRSYTKYLIMSEM